MKNKLLILATVMLIIGLMSILVALAILIVLVVAWDAEQGNKGLSSITAFILAAIIFGTAMNKVINIIKRLWNIS